MKKEWRIIIVAIISFGYLISLDAATPELYQNMAITNSKFSLNSTLASKPPVSRTSNTGRRLKRKKGNTNSRGKGDLQQIADAFRNSVIGRARKSARTVQPFISKKQIDAMQHLANENIGSTGVRAYFNSQNGTPSFLKLKTKPPGFALRGTQKSKAEAVALQFLSNNADLIKLNNPELELKQLEMDTDPDGKTHFRYQQVYKNIPVWGSEIRLHLGSDLGIYLFNGRYQPTPSVNTTTPKLTSQEAINIAMKELGVTWLKEVNSELVIYSTPANEKVLSYKIDTLPDIQSRWILFIDAANGKLIHKIKNIHQNVVAAQGVDSNSQNQEFNAWSENGLFYMIDPTMPLDDPVHNPLYESKPTGDTYIFDARNGDGSSLYFSTSNSVDSDWDPVAVSAMSNTKKVYDYYLNTHSLNSMDGNYKNLLVVIHLGNNYSNAFWNGSFMVYGDGDEQTFTQLAKCLDVASHEMTHGVIEATANLQYENQSGALNESFADIFAAMVDRDDWLIGEDCVIATPGYLRNMASPSEGLSAQPDKMSDYVNLPNTPDTDNGGVHINSGIPNRAAYLIAEGLTNEGSGVSIGKEKMELIFYRALTTYLTSSSQFIDARRATIQAAEDIYGASSTEVAAVENGWNAVEVTEADSETVPDSPSPTPTDAITGSDFMVYLYPIDGTRDDDPQDTYALYRQQVSNDLVYSVDDDTDLQNTISASPGARPAVFTDNEGSWVLFVGDDQNIYATDLQTNVQSQLTYTSDIWSIAVSETGNYVTYTTTDLSDNNIYVMDTIDVSTASYPISEPDYTGNNETNLNMALYADSMSFDYTGRYLVFDFYNCVTTETSSCESGDGYYYWSIGIMDVTTGSVFFPFPDQNSTIDLGYPAFAKNNNFVIALDYHDYSNFGSVDSQVLTVNFETQEVNLVYDFGTNNNEIVGVPSFWGNDSYITIQLPSGGQAGTIGSRISLGTNGDGPWEGSNGSLETVNPYAVAMPVMYRIGAHELTGSLTSNATGLNFGDLQLNSVAEKTLLLTNNGNNDINITDIQLDGDAFSHNGTNTILPRQSSITLTIEMNSGEVTGAKVGTLNFAVDGEANALSVSLYGNTVSGSNGRGGSTDRLFLLFLVVLLLGHYRRGVYRK